MLSKYDDCATGAAAAAAPAAAGGGAGDHAAVLSELGTTGDVPDLSESMYDSCDRGESDSICELTWACDRGDNWSRYDVTGACCSACAGVSGVGRFFAAGARVGGV